MKPFFSVLTPVLNGSAFIESYIGSLRSQLFSEWEAIIVDDGSTDSSIDMLLGLACGDDRFKVFRSNLGKFNRPAKGPYDARNVAIAHASGSFICFLDIDDLWLPNKLLDQYKLLKSNPSLQLLYGDYYKADSTLRSAYIKPRLDFIPIKIQILFWNPIPLLTSCVSAALASSCQFKPIGHEDFIFWHEIISRISESQIAKTEPTQAVYRTSSSSLSGNKLTVIKWWLDCYHIMGYSTLFSLLFLLVRVSAEFAEVLRVSLGIVRKYQIYLGINSLKPMPSDPLKLLL